MSAMASRPRLPMTAGIAAAQRLLDWAEAAAPQTWVVYAQRPGIVTGSACFAAAHDLQLRGLVNLFQVPSAVSPTDRDYLAQRSSRPWKPAVAAPPKPVLKARRRDDGDFTAGEALLPVLTRAAQFGRPCPTDKQLAKRASIDVERVQAGLDALRAANEIRVTSAPAPTLRRVLIIGPGWQTGVATS